jgi:hypothetical protein
MGCIDRGRSLVKATQKQVARYVATMREINATLDPTTGGYRVRKRMYGELRNRLLVDEDPIHQQMGRVMSSFRSGLFVGGSRCDGPHDNLDLERWFRLPKGHERRIHGRSHAGVRIVQEGETLMLTLDAHRQHPEPFTEADLRAYRDAEVPPSQKEVMHRRKVMRAARSPKKRAKLLRDLEKRYAESSPR